MESASLKMPHCCRGFAMFSYIGDIFAFLKRHEIDGHLAAPLRRLLLQVICQSLPALFAQGATVPRTTAGPGHRKEPLLTPTRVARRRDNNLPGREGALFLPCPCLVSTSSWVCHTDKVGAVPSGTPSFTIVRIAAMHSTLVSQVLNRSLERTELPDRYVQNYSYVLQ
ncbi:hypothetical protein T12_13055 [Trichinella patagoniensis]|uniref:Uncharacterized protein n=1 Tax=Trichinella patagoniensis TaxID=990121 RepID=A0A0V0ZQI8_9BILA|nr:hypothetical protein T12_13055 [Trichinella patagoniensis]